MNLVCRDMDGEEFRIEAKAVREVVPCMELFVSDFLAEPTSALIHYKSKLLPLRGAVPDVGEEAWILILGDYGRIVATLPEMETEESSARENIDDFGELADSLEMNEAA